MSDQLEVKKKDQPVDALLAEYYRTRDIELRNKLVGKYLYIAEIIAKKFTNRGIEYDDLFQVASLALIKALERYDVTKGFKFSSFATPTIVGEIKNYFRDKSRIIRLPRKESEFIKKIENAKSYLLNQFGRSPTPEEIGEYLGITSEQVLELIESNCSTKTASLDYYIDNEGETDLMAVIGNEEKNYQLIEDRDFIQRVMSTLTEQERKVINERFYNGRSQREISEEMGVSQMYISRMERRVLERFRRQLKKDM
ncbi:MAG TPA: B/F/G family RNA polymerase sigma-70 factor [Clostridiales bacterium]|nr:sigma-70 family RNA polymerase sigma factor [Clostridia bacterium]HCS75828.1 B/F/G family RNA polymerase sigma-70 factor [Clostridiales bacterium]